NSLAVASSSMPPASTILRSRSRSCRTWAIRGGSFSYTIGTGGYTVGWGGSRLGSAGRRGGGISGGQRGGSGQPRPALEYPAVMTGPARRAANEDRGPLPRRSVADSISAHQRRRSRDGPPPI